MLYKIYNTYIYTHTYIYIYIISPEDTLDEAVIVPRGSRRIEGRPGRGAA